MSAPCIKVCFVGTTNVGKTSILIRIDSNTFNPTDTAPTTSMKTYIHTYTAQDGQKIQIIYWDTAGQERFKGLGNLYYQNAQLCVAVFDITSDDSFKEAHDYVGHYKEYCGLENYHIIYVGNKTDLLNDPSAYSDKLEWADLNGYKMMLTSALNGDGIQELIQVIIDELTKSDVANEPEDTPIQITISDATVHNKKKSKCC